MMEKITEREIINKAYEIKGTDQFWDELKRLKSDIDFFMLFMEREAKSSFAFDIRVSHGMARNAFTDLWRNHGFYKNTDTLKTVFSEFILLRYMIETLYNVSEGEVGLAELTVSEKELFVQFIEYLEQYNGFNKYAFITETYVSDFIGCSRGCSAVQQKISVLKQERKQ